ncbi:hypothetical protein AB685_01525 [Bacillus sp. LL01]|uniref:DoxX family protein n=1 Tax=Bacillus sp. LL01 TaxID=1665556 RepID=UPI00064D2E9A|nr:DoxX family protein [Bacillus sp. LL01]KMJ59583.1 hypothetical protein AB685_01525 [Bacillus sp. LL01]
MLLFTLIIQVVIGTLFAFLSFLAFTGAKYSKEKMIHLQLPNYFRYVTGFVQLLGGMFMLSGIWYTDAAILGGVWITMIMLVSMVLRIRANESIISTTPAIIIGILSSTVSVVNI